MTTGDARGGDARRKWTFMVYLAGDNDLELCGLADLREMEAIGSTADVAVVAQFDRMTDDVTRRYVITGAANLEDDCVQELPETNTGDPAFLLDFARWACDAYPADHYALVLWNHGTGWKDDDIYAMAEQAEVPGRISRGQVRGLASGKSSRALFSSSLRALIAEAAHTQRAILLDDSSADFLDNVELKGMLAGLAAHLGRPLDLLGMDACLMNMLEVDYQLRGSCDLVVASQEIEPGEGWPYDTILLKLVESPDMAPELLARTIVDEYIGTYRDSLPSGPVTQSAVRVAAVEPVARAVNQLGLALAQALPARATQSLLFGALRSAQSFADRDYVDLVHLCGLLAKGAAAGPVGAAALEVVQAVGGAGAPLGAGAPTGAGGPLLAAAHHGATVANAHGLSIYLPARVLSPHYARLDFCQDHGWDEFVAALVALA